ncbi:MAG: hypothetical protein QY309_04780 [Cyclobacteriaceae bacterium]|nr:MAG: hypothetical protein QY309_04780 [Cyclobacteriaceae bacterium]
MGSLRINEIAVNQATHSPQDAIGLDEDVVAVVIRNAFDSTQYMMVGWNQPANMGNYIPPATSLQYGFEGFDIAGNKLYIKWDGTSGGKALITVYSKC